jgi:hypothetical protein
MKFRIDINFPQLERFLNMGEKLQAALAELTEEVRDSKTKLQSIDAFVQGVPNLVAKAVADALAAHDVADEEAAATIDAARSEISAEVDSVLSAVRQNTPDATTGDEPT